MFEMLIPSDNSPFEQQVQQQTKSWVLIGNWMAKLLINLMRDGESTVVSNGPNKMERLWFDLSSMELHRMRRHDCIGARLNFNRIFGHANFCVTLLIGPGGSVWAAKAHSIGALCCQTNYCICSFNAKMRDRHWTVCELCDIPFFQRFRFFRHSKVCFCR